MPICMHTYRSGLAEFTLETTIPASREAGEQPERGGRATITHYTPARMGLRLC